MTRIIYKISILLAIISCFSSCKAIKTEKVINIDTEESIEPIQIVSLEIFDSPNSKITHDLDNLIRSDSSLNNQLLNKPVRFELKCDTTTGKILHVECKSYYPNFSELTSGISTYFRDFLHVNYIQHPISGKVDTYWLIVWLTSNELKFTVEYGYIDFEKSEIHEGN